MRKGRLAENIIIVPGRRLDYSGPQRTSQGNGYIF